MRKMDYRDYRIISLLAYFMILILVILQIFQTRLYPMLEANPIFLFLSINWFYYPIIFIVFYVIILKFINSLIKTNQIRLLKILTFALIGLAIVLGAMYELNTIPIHAFNSTLNYLSSNNVSTCYTTPLYPTSQYCVYHSNYSAILTQLT